MHSVNWRLFLEYLGRWCAGVMNVNTALLMPVVDERI